MAWTPAFLLNKIPIGQWVKVLIEFLTDYFDDQFGLFSDGLEVMIRPTITVFEAVPPIVLILALIALAYGLHRSWKGALGLAAALLLILNLGN